MGVHRNGARTFLELVATACKMSHMRGFRSGISLILGGDVAAELYLLWTPFCTFVEALIAADNWFNQKDTDNTDADGEDAAFGV